MSARFTAKIWEATPWTKQCTHNSNAQYIDENGNPLPNGVCNRCGQKWENEAQLMQWREDWENYMNERTKDMTIVNVWRDGSLLR